jgi:hypothetical protein
MRSDESRGLWSCPECAFTFDAMHTDRDGGYSCPLCGEIRAEAERDDALARAVAAETAIAKVRELAGTPETDKEPSEVIAGGWFPRVISPAQLRAALAGAAPEGDPRGDEVTQLAAELMTLARTWLADGSALEADQLLAVLAKRMPLPPHADAAPAAAVVQATPEPTKTAAELIREVAERDPEAHRQALGRAYGVGPEQDQAK